MVCLAIDTGCAQTRQDLLVLKNTGVRHAYSVCDTLARIENCSYRSDLKLYVAG